MTATGANRSIVLTPPGPGAIGVIRVIGPDAWPIVARQFVPQGGKAFSGARLDGVRQGWFVDAGTRERELIDEVLVSSAETDGLSAVDICAHGGIRVMERILEALHRSGAPLGEADRQTYKLWPAASLIEDEADDALERAKTERAVLFLARQREGLVRYLREAAALCRDDSARAARALRTALSGYRPAATLLEGAEVAIVGPPNSGKSTLFNRLVGRSATLASAQAGTTRDWIAESIEMDGVPLTLVDTAGQCEAADSLEARAVEVGSAVANAADLCIVLLDGSQPLTTEAWTSLAASRARAKNIVAANKADLGLVRWSVRIADRAAGGHAEPLAVSARTGAGIDALLLRILGLLGFGNWDDREPCLFTSRQARAAEELLTDHADDPVALENGIRMRLIGTR